MRKNSFIILLRAFLKREREMGKADKERLSRILGEHLNTIHETFQVRFVTYCIFCFDWWKFHCLFECMYLWFMAMEFLYRYWIKQQSRLLKMSAGMMLFKWGNRSPSKLLTVFFFSRISSLCCEFWYSSIFFVYVLVWFLRLELYFLLKVYQTLSIVIINF